MNKKVLSMLAAGLISLSAASSVSAIVITATSTGPITAYFYGQSAAYGSDIGMWVNGVFQGVYGLQNHLSSPGDSLVLGSATLGDSIMFELRVSTGNGLGPPPHDYSVYSDPTWNFLGEEHAMASPFAGGPFGIPTGTLIGFEDIIPLGASDLDYNDHLFVFTGVSAGVPDSGATVALLGLGLASIAAFRRKARA